MDQDEGGREIESHEIQVGVKHKPEEEHFKQYEQCDDSGKSKQRCKIGKNGCRFLDRFFNERFYLEGEITEEDKKKECRQKDISGRFGKIP